MKTKLLISISLLVVLLGSLLVAINLRADNITVADPCIFTLSDGTSVVGTAVSSKGVVVVTDNTGKVHTLKEADIVKVTETVANTRITKSGTNRDSMLLKAFTGTKEAHLDVTIGVAATKGNINTTVGTLGLHSRISTDNWRLSNKTDIEFGGERVDYEQWSCTPAKDVDTDIVRFATITDIELRIGTRYFWFLRNNNSRMYDVGIDADIYLATGGGFYIVDTEDMKLSLKAGFGPHMVWYIGEGDDFGTAAYAGILFEKTITEDLIFHTELDLLYNITQNSMTGDRTVCARMDTYLQYKLMADKPVYANIGIANIYRDDVILGMDKLDTRFYAKLVYRF